MSSAHDFLPLSQLHSSLSRIRAWLFGPREKTGNITLDRAIAEAEELAEGMERVMPRVYAQAYALANKSEVLAYWMVEWREEGVERLRKVLEMEKVGERPKGMNEVRDSLSYLVELESLKLASIQTHSSTSPSAQPPPHSPVRSPPTPSSLSTAKQLLALHHALGLNPNDSLPLRELMTENGVFSQGKIQQLPIDDLLDRFLTPIMELISCEEAMDDGDFLEFQDKLKEKMGRQVLFARAEGERQAEDCFRECKRLIDTALEMCAQEDSKELDLTEPSLQPWPSSLPSLTSHLRLSLLRLQQSILVLTQSHRTHTSALNTLKLSNSLLKHLLKTREQELETLGEEYYSFATQNTISNEISRRRIAATPGASRMPASRQESETFSDLRSPMTGRLVTSFPEDEDVHTDETLGRPNPIVRAVGVIENMEKLAIVLHLDSERQTETLQSAYKLWVYLVRSQRLVTDMSKSALENASLEGYYKAKILKCNPIVGLLSANILALDELLPSYQLFPVLFQVLDFTSCQSDSPKSFPDMILDYLSLTLPIKTKVYQFLGNLLLSLQSYFAEEYSYAVFFARLMRVYHPDPLLEQASYCFLRINAYLLDVAMQSGVKALSVKMTDEEAGGNVFLSTALELAFRLPFSSDLTLFSHFLTCIRPLELSPLEWAAFIISSKADFLMIDLNSISFPTETHIYEFLKNNLALESVISLLKDEVFSPETLIDLVAPQVYADIKCFLFMPRGFLLDSFLQVYDLYVDSLFPLLSQYCQSQVVAELDYKSFLHAVYPGLSGEEKAEIWSIAGELTPDPPNITRDSGLLAVLICEYPAIAAKPIYLREVEARSPAGYGKGISFEYRNGRVAVSFREERSERRRKTTAMQSRFGRVRVRRDLAAANA